MTEMTANLIEALRVFKNRVLAKGFNGIDVAVRGDQAVELNAAILAIVAEHVGADIVDAIERAGGGLKVTVEVAFGDSPEGFLKRVTMPHPAPYVMRSIVTSSGSQDEAKRRLKAYMAELGQFLDIPSTTLFAKEVVDALSETIEALENKPEILSEPQAEPVADANSAAEPQTPQAEPEGDTNKPTEPEVGNEPEPEVEAPDEPEGDDEVKGAPTEPEKVEVLEPVKEDPQPVVDRQPDARPQLLAQPLILNGPRTTKLSDKGGVDSDWFRRMLIHDFGSYIMSLSPDFPGVDSKRRAKFVELAKDSYHGGDAKWAVDTALREAYNFPVKGGRILPGTTVDDLVKLIYLRQQGFVVTEDDIKSVLGQSTDDAAIAVLALYLNTKVAGSFDGSSVYAAVNTRLEQVSERLMRQHDKEQRLLELLTAAMVVNVRSKSGIIAGDVRDLESIRSDVRGNHLGERHEINPYRAILLELTNLYDHLDDMIK